MVMSSNTSSKKITFILRKISDKPAKNRIDTTKAESKFKLFSLPKKSSK